MHAYPTLSPFSENPTSGPQSRVKVHGSRDQDAKVGAQSVWQTFYGRRLLSPPQAFSKIRAIGKRKREMALLKDDVAVSRSDFTPPGKINSLWCLIYVVALSLVVIVVMWIT